MQAGVSTSCTMDVVMKKLWPDQAQSSQKPKSPVSKEQFRTGAGPENELSVKKGDKHDLHPFHYFAFPIGRGMAKPCER